MPHFHRNQESAVMNPVAVWSTAVTPLRMRTCPVLPSMICALFVPPSLICPTMTSTSGSVTTFMHTS